MQKLQLFSRAQQRSLSLKNMIKRWLFSEYFIFYLSIIYFLVLSPFVPYLATLQNFSNILANIWPLFAVAVGQTVVLIVAGIDLSQTAVISVTSVIGSLIMTKEVNPTLFSKSPVWGWFLTPNGGPLASSVWAVPVAILAMLIVGTLIGLLNGVSVAKLNLPPFMVTLVTQMFFGAFAIYLTKSENVINLPQSFNNIGTEGIGFIPYSLFVAGVLGILAHLLLTKTVLGRWIYAVGTNIKASVVSGVPADKTIIFAYAFSGFSAAVGSVLYSSRLMMGRPTLGQNILLDIIGAVVIGGTSLFGGKGKIVWTLFGVLFFVILSNTLNLFNLSFFVVNIVKGAVILLAALFDVIRTRIKVNEF